MTEAGRLLVGMAAACAILCAVPVLFGLLVARWDKRWSSAKRKGPMR